MGRLSTRERRRIYDGYMAALANWNMLSPAERRAEYDAAFRRDRKALRHLLRARPPSTVQLRTRPRLAGRKKAV